MKNSCIRNSLITYFINFNLQLIFKILTKCKIKERNYVADCFKRIMKYFKSNVDYAVLFDPNKAGKFNIRNTKDEPKKNSSVVFGKEYKKSNRRPRPSFGVELN